MGFGGKKINPPGGSYTTPEPAKLLRIEDNRTVSGLGINPNRAKGR
jgi:hypothetical protein